MSEIRARDVVFMQQSLFRARQILNKANNNA